MIPIETFGTVTHAVGRIYQIPVTGKTCHFYAAGGNVRQPARLTSVSQESVADKPAKRKAGKRGLCTC